MELPVFVLAAYGVTNIITQARVLLRLREWLGKRSELAGHWIRCPMCVGVPVGAAWVLAGLGPGCGRGLFLEVVVGAAVSSGTCWILRVLLRHFGEDEL